MWKIKFEKVVRTSKDDQLHINLKTAIEAGGWEAGKEVCRNTKGSTSANIYRFIDEIVIKERKL